MEKNFLNITPESGNGNQEVTINAKANISLEDREEMLRIRSSTGKEAKVRIIQDGVPFYTSGMIKYSVYPKNISQLDFIPTLRFMSFGVNDDQDKTKYPIYNYAIKKNDSNYDFFSDIKYHLLVSIKSGLIDGKYDLELETPNSSVYLNNVNKLGSLNLDTYEGEIFLSNGTDIVSEMSLRLTNKNDAYDYVTLFQLTFF